MRETEAGHPNELDTGVPVQREIAGIDMVHARIDSFAKNRDRTGNIAWRAPNPLVAIPPGELHGPITDTGYSQRRAREGKAATETRLFFHFVFPP